MRKTIVSMLLPLYLGSIFFGFLLYTPQAQATWPSGLNVAPSIISPSTFRVSEWDTVIWTVVATDQDNVVMEYGATTVTGNTWKNISHSEMCNPVVVSSARADVDWETQRVVRVKDKSSLNFDIKVDNQWWSVPAAANTPVDWVVVNAWAQNFIDDLWATWNIQANSLNTETNLWNACRPTFIPTTSNDVFSPAFSALPSVIHSISSNNDTTSTASSVNANDGNRTSEPTTTSIGTFLQRWFGVCDQEADLVDYLAMDQWHFIFGGVEIDSVRSSDSIAAVNASWYPITFTAAFSSVPQTILTSQLGEDGGNWGFWVVHTWGTPTTTSFPASVDEDGSTSRWHTTEPFWALAFENASWKITQPSVLSYSISGWADAFEFVIDSQTWELTANGDLFWDNFEVEVQVCDDHCNSKCATQTITVDVQNTPTDINLSNNALDENVAANTTVWSFSTIDLDVWDTHSYSLISWTWDSDNSAFTITGNTLSINTSPDFETQSSYSIRVQTDDGNGWNYQEVFTITINNLDEVAPVILLTWSDLINVIKNNTYTDAWATCTDDVDASCNINVWWATVDTTTLGSYIISYDATDAAWNIATQVTRTVNVIAWDAPIISRIWWPSVNVEVNSTYTDAWATANDTEDWDISADIVIVNTVDTSILWTNTITYNVDDSSDNSAIEVTRIVNVVDTTPPAIMLVWLTSINVIKNASYSDAWATASDNFNGDISADIVTVNPVDTSTLWTYIVTYNVFDSSSNSATQVTRTVNVIVGDTPTITLTWTNPITHEVNTSYTDAWATATDSEDGDISTDIVTINPVDTTTLWTYTVSYDVDDSSDNSAPQITRTVNIVDTTDPIIILTGSDPINLVQWSSFTDPWATCGDNFDASCTVDVWWDSVDVTRVGTYVITYNAVDSSGNNATTVNRTVNVTPAPLLINEVEYDTPGNENEAEWFEIYNPTSWDVNIENWTITEAVWASSNKTFTFSSQTIPAWGYIIVTNETTDFQLVYPGVTPDVDLPWAQYFNLKNSPSDELELKDPNSDSIDFVRWEDTAGWWDLEAINAPICRLLVADTGTDADWSDECIPTPGAQNDFNAIPTDIVLSSEDIDENNSAWANIWTLSTLDTDVWDTHTYSLVAGTGDTDNGSFSISGNTLSIIPVTDYETKQSYDIRIASNDGNGWIYEEAFTIDVNDINLAPTDIVLSNDNLDENNTVWDTIGTLSGIDDGEDSNILTYALACSTPWADDTSFAISGTDLNAGTIYDFESKSTYNICIQVSDGLLTYDENFIVNINDLDEVDPVVVIAPVTKLQNSAISDTTIQVTDDVWVNVADISIDASSTANASALVCAQTSATIVDCTISVDTSGDLVISALDTTANSWSDTELNYIVDTIPPNVPSVSVDTLAPFSIDSPELTFSSLDNVGVDYYTVTYSADDGSPTWTGTLTTINPATSPVVLGLDPEEPIVHTIVVTVYDEAGNSSSTTIKFPPIITFNAPTTLSNTTITDSTVTISTPTGNTITNIQLDPGSTSATLWTCTGTWGWTTDPFISPVTCDINSLSDSWTITVTADDSIILASGRNSQSYIIDTTPPVVTITAPTKLDNAAITDTTIIVTDETAINVADVSIDWLSTVTSSLYSCTQTSPSRVDCTISIDDSWDLTISADDVAGNTDTETETDYIIDTIPPVISLLTPSPETVEYLSAYTDGWAIFTDNIDGTWSLVWVWSVNTWILGAYTLTYNYTDTAGNPWVAVTRTVSVVDTTPPVITLTGNATETVEVNTSYSDEWATATDNFDGNLTSSITALNSVDITTVGVYTVTYIVVDTNTNIATEVTRTVNVVDTTPPVVTLTGLDEIVLEVGSSYSELWATATDNEDTILPTSIVIDASSVDTSIIGSYDVTYNVSDASGNNAIEVIRTVTIEDTTLPVITLVGNAIETVEVNTSYTDAWATATDNYDGDISGNIITNNPVNTAILWSYTITYNIIDSSSNASTQVTRTVNVVDTTLPVITLVGNPTETVEVNTNYTDAWATASDNFDGNLTSDIVVINPVDTASLWSYTVSYNVTDTNTNIATEVIRTVNILDTTPPVINLTGSSPLTIYKNATYTEFGALCTDNFDATCSITIWWDTVDTSTLWTYIVSYDVTDANANIATQVTRIVNVIAGNVPVITLTGNTTETIEVNTSYIDAWATATDTEDGNISSSLVVVNPVDITSPWTYVISYNITDSSDNIGAQVTRTVNVVDTTPPVINLTWPSTIDIFKNTTYTEFWAICADNFDATCSVTIWWDTIDTATLWTYAVTYNAIDTNTNVATQVTRTVNIIAWDVPLITLTWSGTLTHEVNIPYTDPGAIATDSEDGNITSSIVINNGVDITSTGSYTVTYDVDDFSDNSATQVTRTVNIVDTTPPVITLIWNAAETVNLWDSYTDAWATCVDNYDISCSVTVNNPVDTNTIWAYTVTYDAIDVNTNIAIQVTRIVNVVTGNPPVINLIGLGSITLLKNTPYTDAWATATDIEDGNISSDIITTNPVDINTLWTYIIRYNIIDSNLNSAVPASRTVEVISGNIPTISLLGENTVFVQKDDIYTDAWATATDIEDWDISLDIVTTNPVDTSTPWVYSVSYNVTDFSDNNASWITRTVIVIDSTTDTDGDGLPDEIEIVIGTDPSITDTNNDGTDDSNNDLDSISPLIELWAANNGDGNNDGILDAIQNEVSSIPNIENTRYNTLSIKNPSDSCNQIQFFASKSESDLSQQDPRYLYDFGLWDFEILCDAPWSTADIQIYLDKTYDTSSWEYRKYDEVTQSYSDISNIVSYTTQTVWVNPVTVINYSITDWGIYDEDGLINGTIIDPSGPSIVVVGGGTWQAWGTWRSNILKKDNTESQSTDDVLEVEDSLQEVIPQQEEIEDIELPEQTIPEQWVDYTLENNFDSCRIIQDIQNPLYQYSEGIFSDITVSSQRNNILKFAQIGIVDGYNDWSFKPYQNMTRTEFLKVALISHCHEYQNEDTSTLIYSDVDWDSWQARVISKAESLWMINGDIDENRNSIFRPNDIITKAEAVKILMRLSFITAQNPVILWYTDITIPWHEWYIITWESLWLFESERDNGKFYPDSWVRRQDMIDLINRLVLLYK